MRPGAACFLGPDGFYSHFRGGEGAGVAREADCSGEEKAVGTD